MKKFVPYIFVGLVLIGLLFMWSPWSGKNNKARGCTGPDSTDVNIQTTSFLPPESDKPVAAKDLNANIFIENSGSMDGYVSLNSEFKDALGKIIVKSNNAYPTHLYFVNNDIFDVEETELGGDVNNFVAQLNSKSMKVGATGSSNINKIFKMVLDKTNKNTVSILFSDFVYSINGTDVSSQVSNAKNATMGAFLDAIKKDPDFATIILQCQSQFNGKYYDRNDKGIVYTGKRPYYIFIMGSYDKVKEIDAQLELNKSQTGIPGLVNKYMLSTKTWELNEETARVLTNSFNNADLIKPERDDYNIDFIKYDNTLGILKFSYALALGNLFVDKSYLTDISNYETEPADVRVLGVDYCTDMATLSEVNDMTKDPLVLQLGCDISNLSRDIKVKLINKMPAWIAKSSIDDDLGMVPGETQTFAIGSLIGGVYDAFHSKFKETPIFEFEIIINKYKK